MRGHKDKIFDEPILPNKALDFHKSAGRFDMAEIFFVSAGRLFPQGNIGQHDPGADYIIKPPARVFDSFPDNPQTVFCLIIEVSRMSG